MDSKLFSVIGSVLGLGRVIGSSHMANEQVATTLWIVGATMGGFCALRLLVLRARSVG